ncbi:MAG TPA: hypothetical protein ENK85_12485 [Saprospiraceae bacterium]|nr:hypothetical protein [Saprospiraceae bacterium]
MGIAEKVVLVIYRVKEKGLEVLLVNDNDTDNWELPKGGELDEVKAQGNLIELESAEDEDTKVMAIEADWHEIPSLRKLIKEDVLFLTDKMWDLVPKMEKSTYFAVKEAFKKVLPKAQYKMLKELKDIISDRNSTKYI